MHKQDEEQLKSNVLTWSPVEGIGIGIGSPSTENSSLLDVLELLQSSPPADITAFRGRRGLRRE